MNIYRMMRMTSVVTLGKEKDSRGYKLIYEKKGTELNIIKIDNNKHKS